MDYIEKAHLLEVELNLLQAVRTLHLPSTACLSPPPVLLQEKQRLAQRDHERETAIYEQRSAFDSELDRFRRREAITEEEVCLV
jgi:hypothetical protein